MYENIKERLTEYEVGDENADDAEDFADEEAE